MSKIGTIRVSATFEVKACGDFNPDSDCYNKIIRAHLNEDPDSIHGLINAIDDFDDTDDPEDYEVQIRTEDGWRSPTKADLVPET